MNDDKLTAGELQDALSNAIVRIMREFYGKGAARSRTMIFDDYVFVVLEDVLTIAEMTLRNGGAGELVRKVRMRFEDLKAAGGVEDDLAVVGDDGAPGQPLDLADERRGHEVLEDHPHPLHEVAGAAVAQGHLGRGQDVLQDDEDVLVEEHRPRTRGTLAVELAHDAGDRVRQRRLQLAAVQLVLGHRGTCTRLAAHGLLRQARGRKPLSLGRPVVRP